MNTTEDMIREVQRREGNNSTANHLVHESHNMIPWHGDNTGWKIRNCSECLGYQSVQRDGELVTDSVLQTTCVKEPISNL